MNRELIRPPKSNDPEEQARFNRRICELFNNLFSSTYNGEFIMRLGSYYFWVDSSGNYRFKSSSPSSETDGTIIATEV